MVASTITAYDAARTLMEYMAQNAAALNAVITASGGHYLVDPSVSSEHKKITGRDRSEYIRLKVGDRDLLDDGLTICFQPVDDEERQAYSSYGVDVWLRVDINVYLKDEPDPKKRHDSLAALSAAISDLYNTQAITNALPVTGRTVALYQSRVFQHKYDLLAIKQADGEVVPTVILWWRGMTTYET